MANNFTAHAVNATHALGGYIREHPVMFTAQAVGVAVAIVPAIVAGPVLGAAGFAASGPVAGRCYLII
jgi:hypothetical protein